MSVAEPLINVLILPANSLALFLVQKLRERRYGRIRGSYGDAEDGKSWDVFVGPNAESDQVYKIRQLDPDTLFHDETKYVVGCDSMADARDLGLIQMGGDRFGGIEPVKPDELSTYKSHFKQDCSDTCGCQKQKPRLGEKPEPEVVLPINDPSQSNVTRDRSKKARKTKPPVPPVDEVEREDESPQNPEDLSDAITTVTLKPSKAAIAKWVALLQTQVTQWLTEGVPMAEIRDRIPTLYERLNGDELAKVLSQGIQLGYLGGLGEEEEG